MNERWEATGQAATIEVTNEGATFVAREPLTPHEFAEAHNCGYSGDYWQCINGLVYGPCADENCGGVCEIERDCVCECHQEAA